MEERRVDVFFYGLFMDVAVLKANGVDPANVRRGYIDGFALRIGHRATLISSQGARVYGMLMALTHSELARLYCGPGLDQYRPEAVLAHVIDGGTAPALCYNLLAEPNPDERNPEYALRLRQTLRALDFPAAYADAVSP
jgi:hypothetical protein